MRVEVFLLIGSFALLTATAGAAPAVDEKAHDPELGVLGEHPEISEDHAAEPDLVRVRRAACDLFSFTSKWVTPGHAVCAAHCIALGNRGGSCKGTVCHCRK